MRDPSGDQTGFSSSLLAPAVTCSRPVPSALITERRSPPSAPPVTKTILVPSGDHAGSLSPVVDVNCVGFVPSAFMIQRFSPSEGPRAKTILVPSGDHAGFSSPFVVVSCVWPDPSAFITQIFVSPIDGASRVNTILVPSADHLGS